MIQKRAFLVFTPVNPTRPFYERLRTLHQRNVAQNAAKLYRYIEREVVSVGKLQNSGVFRGQNVCREFNEVYEKYGKDHKFICKWDDDIILPPNILNACRVVFDDDPEVVGVGLFQEEYGAPNILMTEPVKDGWYGAFSRFYCYRINKWGRIPIRDQSGDPDNAFQKEIKGKKHVIDVPNIHLDHRCFTDRQYKVLLDTATFFTLR